MTTTRYSEATGITIKRTPDARWRHVDNNAVLLDGLQRIHDRNEPEDWPEMLLEAARYNGFDTHALEPYL